MATIKAFGALRFTSKAGRLEELVCPPYDIISDSERKQFLAQNECNIIRLELPRDGREPYKQAQSVLEEWLREGVLARDESPGLYLYREVFSAHGKEMAVMGMVCMVKLEEFEKGVVLPHENTLSKAKTDRFNLMCATGCNLSSIYSLYFDGDNSVYPRLEAHTQRPPMMEFRSGDGILHQVWKIDDAAEIQAIAAAFETKKLYIADGHHRYETALNYRNHLRESEGAEGDAGYVMMTLTHMEHPGLVVFPTHRVVRDLDAFDADRLLGECGERFSLQELAAQELPQAIAQAEERGERVLGMVLPGAAYLMGLRDADIMKSLLPDASEAMRGLNVSVLHELILERLLGIDKENMANQRNLSYTRDAQEAIAAVADASANCAFLLGATRVDEIAAVAAAGEKMPQKSTYFYPKLITGHLMARIRD